MKLHITVYEVWSWSTLLKTNYPYCIATFRVMLIESSTFLVWPYIAFLLCLNQGKLSNQSFFCWQLQRTAVSNIPRSADIVHINYFTRFCSIMDLKIIKKFRYSRLIEVRAVNSLLNYVKKFQDVFLEAITTNQLFLIYYWNIKKYDC